MPSLSDIDYQPGDIVWAYEPLSRTKRRGVIKDGPPHRIEFGDGAWGYYPQHRLRPYSAIDRLADLITCETCRKRPADCLCFKFTITECAGTDMAQTCAISETDSNADPISQLGDLVRTPERRPLSCLERHRRRRRSWLAKRARRRNR